MKYQFIDQAKIEFDEAMEFYDSRVLGLGIKLFNDFGERYIIHSRLHAPKKKTWVLEKEINQINIIPFCIPITTLPESTASFLPDTPHTTLQTA